MSVNEKFKQFVSLNYVEQAKAFLNAYWGELSDEGEPIWGYAHQFIALDHENGKQGCDLDEFNAHRFLEKLGDTKTVKDLREELRAIDMDFNKRMALLEYLLYHYRRTIDDFVRRPQGENTEEVAEAQRQLEAAQRSLQEAQDAVEASEAAAAQAAIEAKKAKDRADEAKVRAEEAAAAEEELRVALQELHEQEHTYNARKQELETRSEDNNLGVVQRNKAKNELAQHMAEDPLPLRRAKLTTEAATKKAEKARIAAEEATARAEEAHREALRSEEAAHEKAEMARVKAGEMEEMFAAAERFLEEVRSRPGGGQGSLWWIDRELKEAKKFMPKRKQ